MTLAHLYLAATLLSTNHRYDRRISLPSSLRYEQRSLRSRRTSSGEMGASSVDLQALWDREVAWCDEDDGKIKNVDDWFQ